MGQSSSPRSPSSRAGPAGGSATARRGDVGSAAPERPGARRPARGASRQPLRFPRDGQTPQTAGPHADDVIAIVQERDIRFIRLWFTDILGQLKSFSINATELDGRVRGRDGLRRLLDHRLQRDRGVRHDRACPTRRPSRCCRGGRTKQGVARMFCDILTPERTPYEGDPRHVLRRALERAQGDGLRPLQRRSRARVLLLPRRASPPRCSTRAATST